jgi:hypothetical protein
MPMVDFWMPHNFIFWAAIVLIVFIAVFFNYLTHLSRNRMLKKLAELGHPITPGTIDRIERS